MLENKKILSCDSEEELNKSGIKSLNDVLITGTIKRNTLDDYVLDVNVKGTAILTCAITLKDVPYGFDIIINDELLNLYEESSIRAFYDLGNGVWRSTGSGGEVDE